MKTDIRIKQKKTDYLCTRQSPIRRDPIKQSESVLGIILPKNIDTLNIQT